MNSQLDTLLNILYMPSHLGLTTGKDYDIILTLMKRNCGIKGLSKQCAQVTLLAKDHEGLRAVLYFTHYGPYS